MIPGALLGPGPVQQVVSDLLWAAELILLVVVVMSWFPLQPGGVPARVYRVLLRITEPVLAPIRRALPRTALDFSPLVAFVGIFVLQRILIG